MNIWELGEGVIVLKTDDLVERGEWPMVSLVLGSHKRRSLLRGLCLQPAGCTSWGSDNEPEVGAFIFYPENIIPILEEHHFVSLDVAVTLFPGLWRRLAWIVAAAPWTSCPTVGSPPPACPPDSGPP